MSIDFRKPAPLYQQISEDIQASILNGTLKVGGQIASQQELAQKYNVSLITVKKALSELIRDGVLYSRVGKGTYVARKPSEFNASKTKALGIVLRDLTSPYFSLVVKGVESAASAHGYNLLVASTSNMLGKEENQIRHYQEIGVSGMIIASMTHVYTASESIRALHQENFPYVVVSYLEDPDIYRVGADQAGGACAATRHLLAQGYRRIWYVNGEEGSLLGEQRRRGYERALQDAGVPILDVPHLRLRLRGEWNDYQSGVEIGNSILAGDVKPEAVFVYNDLSALGLMQSLLNGGVKVPDDIAIVGFDDIGRAQFAPVPLTTIHQPTFEIGGTAVDILLRRMSGQPADVVTILQPRLVVRESCGANRPRV